MMYNDISKQKDLSFFVDVIFNSFIQLSRNKSLLHTKIQIEKNLRSENSVIILIMKEKKIIGFLTGNITVLDDRRQVFFISYIYVVENSRNKKIGSTLLQEAEKIAKQSNCLGMMLIFDTYDKILMYFYETHGYMLDINLRRYERHDVFYKTL